MAWDFTTASEFQQKRDWMRDCVAQEVEAIDVAFGGQDAVYDVKHAVPQEVIRPFQEQVKAQGLRAGHLDLVPNDEIRSGYWMDLEVGNL